jgi:hypothetical protein
MKITPNSFEFTLFLTLTIIILLVKLSLAIYLSITIYGRKKATEKFSFDFLLSICILMFCLFISRLLYAIFDFSLTQFDTSKAHLVPSIIVWKCASLSASIGFAVVLYTLDKKIINFKLKGILAWITLGVAIIQFFYPVNTAEDFEVVSSMNIIANIAAIAFPVVFLYTGIKTPGLRKISFTIAFGVIIYAIGSNLVIEAVLMPLREIYGPDIQITMYFLLFIFKTIGLLMFSYGVSKFTAS